MQYTSYNSIENDLMRKCVIPPAPIGETETHSAVSFLNKNIIIFCYL